MKAKTTFLALALAVGASAAAFAEPLTLKVVGQRVNLRARADLNAEVVGQLAENDVVTAKSVGPEWVEIVPPESIDLWVHRDFVDGDVITGNKVNVRAGAGINYTVVGALPKGAKLVVRGTFGEWLKIAPPPACSLWVNKDLVKIPLGAPKKPAARAAEIPQAVKEPLPVVAGPVPPAPASAATPAPKPAPAAVDVIPPPPADLRLVPLEGQGKLVRVEGLVKPSPFAVGRPSAYRLVQRQGNSFNTICYVRGDRDALRARQGHYTVVRGREYWVQGIRQPIVVIEEMGEPATN